MPQANLHKEPTCKVIRHTKPTLYTPRLTFHQHKSINHPMPVLTAQQRTNGGKAAAQLRRAEKAELVKLREWFQAQPVNKPDQQPAQQTPNPSEILTRTRDHIDAIDKLISDCSDAREMDALTRSREREWRIFAHLSNLPGPGNLKPSSKPSQARPRTIEPTAMPLPQPAQDNAAQGNVEQGKAVG